MSVANPLITSHLLIVFLYLPTLPQAIGVAARIRSNEAHHTLQLSFRFFWALLGRWGNGKPWSVVYGLLLLAGVAAVVRRRDVTLALLVWLTAPFVFYVNAPFMRLFDIRYVMGALPPSSCSLPRVSYPRGHTSRADAIEFPILRGGNIICIEYEGT
jgi:hypothetical protein